MVQLTPDEWDRAMRSIEDENNDSSLFLQRAFQFTFLLGLAKTESILN